MDLFLASNNNHKISEIRSRLEPIGIRVLNPKDEGIQFDAEETGKTFEENAIIKAEILYKLTGKPVLADDSGLTVESLNGRPGVYSSRYAGDNASDMDNNVKLLKELKAHDNRKAAFICVMAFIWDKGTKIFTGSCEGTILEEFKGQSGFGYDPLFYLPALKKTMAEINIEEKNTISHRGKALDSFLEFAVNNLI